MRSILLLLLLASPVRADSILAFGGILTSTTPTLTVPLPDLTGPANVGLRITWTGVGTNQTLINGGSLPVLFNWLPAFNLNYAGAESGLLQVSLTPFVNPFAPANPIQIGAHSGTAVAAEDSTAMGGPPLVITTAMDFMPSFVGQSVTLSGVLNMNLPGGIVSTGDWVAGVRVEEVFTSVPEPATWFLSLLGVTCLIGSAKWPTLKW